MASLPTSIWIIYVILINDKAILGYFLKYQFINPLNRFSISIFTLVLALDLGFALALALTITLAQVLTLALVQTLAIVF